MEIHTGETTTGRRGKRNIPWRNTLDRPKSRQRETTASTCHIEPKLKIQHN
jgi:hypothetical protein